MRPEPSQHDADGSQDQTRLRLGERIDPAAADALWRIVFGPGAAKRREPEATADGGSTPSAPPPSPESPGD